MQHALVGGIVGLAVSIVGAAVTWKQGTGLRAPLVSTRPHRARNAASLGGRQAPPHAVARTAGVIGSLLLLRLRVLEIRRFVYGLTRDELIATVQQKRTRTCPWSSLLD